MTSPIPGNSPDVTSVLRASAERHTLLMFGDEAVCGCEQHMSRSEGAADYFEHFAAEQIDALHRAGLMVVDLPRVQAHEHLCFADELHGLATGTGMTTDFERGRAAGLRQARDLAVRTGNAMMTNKRRVQEVLNEAAEARANRNSDMLMDALDSPSDLEDHSDPDERS